MGNGAYPTGAAKGIPGAVGLLFELVAAMPRGVREGSGFQFHDGRLSLYYPQS
jgi:hypothetical protein